MTFMTILIITRIFIQPDICINFDPWIFSSLSSFHTCSAHRLGHHWVAFAFFALPLYSLLQQDSSTVDILYTALWTIVHLITVMFLCN